MVYCQAKDYVIKDYGKKVFLYDKSYDGNRKALILSAILELFYPEATNFYIPIGVCMFETDKDIYVDKKLNVSGCEQYEYVIFRSQYDSWKRTYAVVKNIMWCLAVIINAALIFLFVDKNWNIALGLCELFFLAITIGAIRKIEKENHRRKKYKVIDMN